MYNHADYMRRYRAANREKINADKRRAYHERPLRELQGRYGVSPAMYMALFNNQHGCCAICGKYQADQRIRMSVDHDHKTGTVRGLLCMHCNHGIGKFHDDPELLLRAVAYLKNERVNVGDVL